MTDLPLFNSWFDLLGTLAVVALAAAAMLVRRLRISARIPVRESAETLEHLRKQAAVLAGRLAAAERALPEASPVTGILARRMGEMEALAGAMARDLARAIESAEPAGLLAAADSARRRAAKLADLAAGGRSRDQQTSLNSIWPRVPSLLGSAADDQVIKTAFAEDLPPIVGPGETWVHILLALVENAVQASPAGSMIEVGAATSPSGDDLVRVWVSDNGPGLQPEVLERVFQLRDQARADRLDAGLGLPFVAALIESLGGTITIVSKLGSGTRVDIQVPPAYRPQAPRRLLRLEGMVLVADDEPVVREAVCRALKRAGMDAVGVDGGTAARAAITANGSRFRALVLDVIMPGTPVADLVAMARKQRANFPVVLMSGYGSGPTVDPILALGGVRFLPKPVSPDQLACSLADLLHSKPEANE